MKDLLDFIEFVFGRIFKGILWPFKKIGSAIADRTTSIKTATAPKVAALNPRTGMKMRGLTFGELIVYSIVAIIALGALAGVIWLGIYLFRMGGIAFGWLSSFWVLKALIGLVMLGLLYDLFRHRKDFSKIKSTWRPNVYFAMGWALVIGLLNFYMSETKLEAWSDLWSYGGQKGSPIFFVTMICLTISVWFIVNNPLAKLRGIGYVILILASMFWMRIAWTVEKTPEEVKMTIADELRQQIRRGPKALIEKGKIARLEVSEIQGVSSVPMMVRLNEQGEFKLYEAGTVEKPGPLNSLPSHVKVIEIKSDEYDIEVFYKTD